MKLIAGCTKTFKLVAALKQYSVKQENNNFFDLSSLFYYSSTYLFIYFPLTFLCLFLKNEFFN